MISDETFPTELFYDEENEMNNEFGSNNNNVIETSKSVEDFNSYLSSENFNNSTDMNQSMVNSLEIERLIKSDFQSFTQQSMKFDESEQPQQHQYTEFSFKSINTSSTKTRIIPPPPAPMKKQQRKKSFSCQDLQFKKNNYDHVESKVKKLIENLAEDRRKTLLRHKSLPVCSQTPTIDENEKSSDEDLSSNDLKRELRRKSIKIYELEEKCEMKDHQIYELECERSKMKMTFDKLRMEMQDLKEIEMKYKQLKSLTSPLKTLRNAQMQTDDSGYQDEASKASTTATTHNYSDYKNENHLIPNPVIRQLAFENSNMNQSHFCYITNDSSDNLIIPEQETLFMSEELDETAKSTQTDINELSASDMKKKKKSKRPKLRQFFKNFSCVAKNK